MSFCGFVMCVLLYVAVIVNFGFNFLIGIYPFEHLCFFSACVTVLRICDFGVWVKLGFVKLLCLWKVLIDVCSKFQTKQLSQLINKFYNFFLIKKKKERKKDFFFKKKKKKKVFTNQTLRDRFDGTDDE